MCIIVDHNGRSQAATTQAPDRLERKGSISCDSSDLYIELFFELIEDLFASFDIASRSQANPNDMLAPWDGGKKSIEENHPVDLGRREVQSLCDTVLDIL